MIDANSTFMAVERSRSGIGALGGSPGMVSPFGAAAANYASKTDEEVGEVVSAVSKTALEVYNYLAKLDDKYEVLNKAKASLDEILVICKGNRLV